MTDLLNHPLFAARYFFPAARALASERSVPVAGATLACGLHRVDSAGFTVVHFRASGEVVADWQSGLDRTINVLDDAQSETRARLGVRF